LMCPSYRATHEEEHSTRGRAHLLWEMTKGDLLTDGWRNEHVKESLDLCLSCKGCKTECPVGVDVASYKAEFLSHYYENRPRPLNAYAFGNIDRWARVASFVPGFVNLGTQLPLLSDIAKMVAGVPKERRIPAFAPQTFKSWFRTHKSANPGATPVILWADTFNNYFSPETAIAAVNVLEAAGFEVLIPRENLCCGRPLYDFGMLTRAKDLLLQILDTVTPYIEADVPVVGLEPSCAAVFRDELRNLFPKDQRAHLLARQTYLLSEFLEKCAPDFQLPQLKRKAIIHGHCHHKALMGMADEESVLRKMGIDFYAPAPGCCGMAGPFGFEEDKFDVSIAIGELELLPAVRKARVDSLIIANGFSCREQIGQCTDRHAFHLAEVIQMALEEGAGGLPGDYPERELVQHRKAAIQRSMTKVGLTMAGSLVGAGLLWAFSRRRF
jgi:Fe-S oxidoreductase